MLDLSLQEPLLLPKSTRSSLLDSFLWRIMSDNQRNIPRYLKMVWMFSTNWWSHLDLPYLPAQTKGGDSRALTLCAKTQGDLLNWDGPAQIDDQGGGPSPCGRQHPDSCPGRWLRCLDTNCTKVWCGGDQSGGPTGANHCCYRLPISPWPSQPQMEPKNWRNQVPDPITKLPSLVLRTPSLPATCRRPWPRASRSLRLSLSRSLTLSFPLTIFTLLYLIRNTHCTFLPEVHLLRRATPSLTNSHYDSRKPERTLEPWVQDPALSQLTQDLV